ncbi:hypothetical protein [Streptomyces sp. PAN_FS17]|uniref:hypothetical protein n=1 Tax=Streptomyces sp. PAN_FS17 TaxID=1855351 RepID=UPI000898A1E3|nr:hypothetical protein [Streptomyces sp. PAN_FS17]SEC64614.1 hypothetical protein SAMN05216482_4080 [Streptomyces sp. PAN_FS17]
MTAPTPAPTGRALALILTGIVITLTTSITAVATGHRQLMVVAAVGFALQLAGWAAHGRRNGGA